MDDLFGDPCALCGTTITRELQASKNEGHIIAIARMRDPRRFDYGMAGQYEFKDELPLKDGDLVCINCMTAHAFEPSKTIECAMCHEMYQPSMPDFDGYKAGWGCCGHVRESRGTLEISCGFGSQNDMMGYVFNGPTTVNVGDLVCDACIDKLVEQKAVTTDASFWENLAAQRPAGWTEADCSVPLPIDDPMQYEKDDQ